MKARLAITYIFNLIDLIATMYLVSLFGLSVEGNPIGRWLIRTNLVYPFKIGVVGGTYKVGQPILIYMAGDKATPVEYIGLFAAYKKDDETKASIIGDDGLVKAGTTGAVVVEATADGFYVDGSIESPVHPTVEITAEQ